MRTSYLPQDVTVLLKDITGLLPPTPAAERERRIQSGTHYSEMLPVEYSPSPAYLQAYDDALARFAHHTAAAVGAVCRRVLAQKGPGVVLVSLARAGTPVGILMKRYLRRFYGVDVPHYTLSIIRGRGIDHNAMQYILARHSAQCVQFVDGWTGKGAILSTLEQALAAYPGVSPALAVLSDPAHITPLSGTKDDFLIPSACLNATVSGLMSRTVLREDLIGADDYHGAVYYGELAGEDKSYAFIEAIEACFGPQEPEKAAAECGEETANHSGFEEVVGIAAHFGIGDVNLVKPGIGEATRVLLRRVPYKILVHSLEDSAYLGHILALAAEKGVPVEAYPLRNYRACGLIQALGDL